MLMGRRFVHLRCYGLCYLLEDGCAEDCIHGLDKRKQGVTVLAEEPVVKGHVLSFWIVGLKLPTDGG